MAQVTVRVNGYAYTIGCKDGEEQHLLAMAAEVEQRIDRIRAQAGPGGESRMLLMAALLLADELHDARQPAEGAAAAPDQRITRRISRAAKRAEDIADGLERP